MAKVSRISKAPNILILMVGQRGAATLAAYDHRLVVSPNIDGLVERLTVVENCYISLAGRDERHAS